MRLATGGAPVATPYLRRHRLLYLWAFIINARPSDQITHGVTHFLVKSVSSARRAADESRPINGNLGVAAGNPSPFRV